ncbi:hypothetical protein LSAT2_019513 [Lamellibrachia satsuma]|nr:hypothetical protein LSAT2_019513 [Lamellibrachia satsuma]
MLLETHFLGFIGDPKVLYETPIRVFVPVPDMPLSLCDYMFQDEVTTDSMDRFRELLDLVIEPDDIQLDAERIPSEEDLAKSEEFDLESVDDNTDPTSTRNLGRIDPISTRNLGVLVSSLMLRVSMKKTQLAPGISVYWISREWCCCMSSSRNVLRLHGWRMTLLDARSAKLIS